ncbi:MAG: acetylglutamate kinase [Eubacteriaceae bacterium]|nr:acetylglutamate kinase [Eubacteriaceae bacterium]
MANKTTIEQALGKAETLIEALPYIQRFNRKIIVVKYGGAAMMDESLKQKVIQDVVLLKLVGFKPIIVHGGGKEISKWVDKVGMDTTFKNGLRVTDEETLELAEMVLAKVNQDLVTLIAKLGVKPVGISGKDGKLLTAEKIMPGGEDIGFVGDVTEVNAEVLYDLLDDDFLPVIFPIGIDEAGQGYNINADAAASAIAEAVGAEKLAFLTDIEGVYKDKDDPDTLISELYETEARDLIDSGLIEGGMLPKLKNCIQAIENGVSRVHILDGRIPHCLLLEIFTDKGVGTAVLHNKEDKFYNERS